MRKAIKRRLEDNSESGWSVEDCPIPGVKEIAHGRFRVFFRRDEKWIVVLTIFGGARNPIWSQLESE